ncbi:hypothetical protein MICAE_1080002 [Microcystis aeruginosa PCC 9806]|uniref:Uncharacterized protein n=1 Tax=Microcystis aeruginosa PCC 9806 TaxID=1160282 RepID=I4GQK7_MICAE|nr:hypothetical protein MICAE_1080002 [Microcystis aeruginosa PCC 9806]
MAVLYIYSLVHAVKGPEVQGIAHRRQIAEEGARGTGVDIFN